MPSFTHPTLSVNLKIYFNSLSTFVTNRDMWTRVLHWIGCECIYVCIVIVAETNGYAYGGEAGSSPPLILSLSFQLSLLSAPLSPWSEQ